MAEAWTTETARRAGMWCWRKVLVLNHRRYYAADVTVTWFYRWRLPYVRVALFGGRWEFNRAASGLPE